MPCGRMHLSLRGEVGWNGRVCLSSYLDASAPLVAEWCDAGLYLPNEENTASRPLCLSQASYRQVSTALGDHAGIPGAECFAADCYEGSSLR